MADRTTYFHGGLASDEGGAIEPRTSRLWRALPIVGAGMFMASVATAASTGAPAWRWWSLTQALGWGVVALIAIRNPRRGARALSSAEVPGASSEHRIAQAVSQRFQTLADMAPIGIFQTDSLGNNVYSNDRWCQITGMSRSEAAGAGWVRALHPEDRARVAGEWSDAVAAGREFSGEYRYQKPDGTAVWVMCNAKSLPDANGGANGYLGAVADITSRKNLESRLQESVTRQTDLAQREELLRRELDHRVRNNLGSLLGLLRMYERSSGDARSLAASMRAVVGAMNDAHQLISSSTGGPVSLRAITQRLVADAAPGRVDFEGPDVAVVPMQINALAMILQELVSNSRKHGALGQEQGRVRIEWSLDPAERSVRMTWTERAENIRPPTTLGTGVSLIRTLARGELRGSCDFAYTPVGLVFTLEARLDTINDAEEPIGRTTEAGAIQGISA